MTDREDDDEQRKSTAGRVERAPIPGAPTRHLPPVRLRPTADEHTPPQPYVAKQRARELTRPGIGQMPPRSLSPVPSERSPLPVPPVTTESERPVIRVDMPGVGEVPVRKRHLRALWIWGAPFVLSALGFVGGAIKGYFVGLAMAHDEVVKIRTTQQIDHDHLTRLDAKEEAAEAEAAAEASSNRAERATALRRLSQFAEDLEKVKAAQPKIQGLRSP